MLKKLNEFFEATTIHGFVYISQSQARSTRIIWTLVVLAAAVVVTYFLTETVVGFSEKYVSTTIESQSIKEYPFPAVTFSPGKYNSKKAFLRNFLNDDFYYSLL